MLLLTSITTDAASCDGAVQVTTLVVTKVAVATNTPNLHLKLAEFTKLLPVTVTRVPPVTGAEVGRASMIVTLGWYVNCTAFVVKSKLLLLTSSATAPTDSLGAVHNILLALKGVALTGDNVPNLHTSDSELAKLDPATVTEVPPATGPVVGETEATEGVAA